MRLSKKRSMTCCCCGEHAGQWQQHWNRDTGYGVCVKCVDWMRGRGTSEAEILNLYGKYGTNWGDHKEQYTLEEMAKAICGMSS